MALRGIERDIAEGADYVMVKPGIFYLDIIKEVASKYDHIPIAVYQVSGKVSFDDCLNFVFNKRILIVVCLYR